MKGQNFLGPGWAQFLILSTSKLQPFFRWFLVPLLSETVADMSFFEWSFSGTVLVNIDKKRLFPFEWALEKKIPGSQKQIRSNGLVGYEYVLSTRYIQVDMTMFASEEPKATTAAQLFGMFCQESSSKTQALACDDLDKLWTSWGWWCIQIRGANIILQKKKSIKKSNW